MEAEADPEPKPVAAAIAQPKAYADALAEARAIPEALPMLNKGSSNSNPSSGRVILRLRDKPKPCKKCKRRKSKKSKKSKKKKKKQKKKCSICNGIYPIPYPAGMPNK